MAELISLEDHNKKHGVLYDVTKPWRNGIACPKCSGELMDSNPSMALASYPPQFRVHCPSCDYHGTRF